jgi:hypothetical protein
VNPIRLPALTLFDRVLQILLTPVVSVVIR